MKTAQLGCLLLRFCSIGFDYMVFSHCFMILLKTSTLIGCLQFPFYKLLFAALIGLLLFLIFCFHFHIRLTQLKFIHIFIMQSNQSLPFHSVFNFLIPSWLPSCIQSIWYSFNLSVNYIAEFFLQLNSKQN